MRRGTWEARARPSKAKVRGGCSDLFLHEKLQFAPRNLLVCAKCVPVCLHWQLAKFYSLSEGIENTETSAVSREQTELEQPREAKEGRDSTCLRAAHSPLVC